MNESQNFASDLMYIVHTSINITRKISFSTYNPFNRDLEENTSAKIEGVKQLHAVFSANNVTAFNDVITSPTSKQSAETHGLF